jgi:hypothetical protein
MRILFSIESFDVDGNFPGESNRAHEFVAWEATEVLKLR